MNKLRFLLYLILTSCALQQPVTNPVFPQERSSMISTSNQTYPTFLSNRARMFLEALAQEKAICHISPHFIPSDYLMLHYPLSILRDSVFCITGFLEVQSDFDLAQLKQLDIHFTSNDYPFSTVYIPLASLCKFLQLKGIVRFELVREAFGALNVARPAVNAQILYPYASQRPFLQGEGVLVGVVDYGFDYTHPDFYDKSGTTYRIARVCMGRKTKGLKRVMPKTAKRVCFQRVTAYREK